MRTLVALLSLAAASIASAQNTPITDSLLDRMAGKWVLRGTIDGKKTVHDIQAKWTIQHHYMLIHEISRDKDKKGNPSYEANVYISWNKASNDYGCAWLDVYGGLSPVSIGMGQRAGDQLDFAFNSKSSVFHTVMSYDEDRKSWSWTMYADESGKKSPFADVVLTRR